MSEGTTTIRISEVLSLLDRGKSRKEIAEHFGKSEAEMQRSVWSHEKLKGRKAKKVHDIVLEDDVDEEGIDNPETTDSAIPGSLSESSEAWQGEDNSESVEEEEETSTESSTPGETWP